ncbi:MAG: deoxyribose-phosphate aldolase [Oscillospiraceae bacterium]|nr:deoxyribose-phosphate aldolase [Oscillospiraceae bacterium]
MEIIKNINRFIDHTNLKPFATKGDIEKLCMEAKEYKFASVCVHPAYVPLAKKTLSGTGVFVGTVIGFPFGMNTTAIKARETADALDMGCDEFDMVINVGALKDGFGDYVCDDISAVVDAAGGRTVKVIIETGLLTDEQKAAATRIACGAGANYVKTCTGISQGVATVEDVLLMKANLSNNAAIKASSGIKTYEAALQLIQAGAARIGTSSGIAIIEGAKGE